MDQPVGQLLKRAQHALRLRMDEALRALGVTTPQYAILYALAQHGPQSNADLARACFVTPQTMNAIVLAMEADGHLKREPHPTHGRIQLAALTDPGRALHAACVAAVAGVEARMEAGFGPGELAALAAGLARCVANLEPGAS